MKTSFKRFAALALAAVMVLGTMNLSALGATNGATGGVGNRVLDSALVISGLDDGDVVRFYKVLEENEDAPTGWIYTSKFIGMSSTKGTSVSTLIGNPAAEPSVSHAITAERAGQIARYVGIAPDSYRYIVTASSGKAQVDNPEPGMYVAIITAADKDVIYNPVFVSADYVSPQSNGNPESSAWEVVTSAKSYAGANAAAKKSNLTIDKSASTSEDGWDDDLAETTAIGDTVSFYVNTTIPGYGKVYQNPVFEISDSLSALKLKKETVKVYLWVNGAKGDQILEGDDTFKLTSGDDYYKIEFKDAYLTNREIPQDIRVEYDAIVTTDALQNVNVENNTVTIKYSTNPTHSSKSEGIPSSPDDFNVKRDETNHYTFTIDANSLFSADEELGKSGSELVKIGIDAAGNRINTSTTWSQVTKGQRQEGALQGAEFKLYTNEACTEEYIPKSANGTSTGKGLELISGADGRFAITGLDAGTYWLKETKAPAGFIKHQDAVKIEIEATMATNTITKWYYNEVWYDTEAAARAAAIADGHPTTAANSEVKTVDEVVKFCTYQTEVLQSYKVKINNKDTATHTFKHSSTNSKIKWSSTQSRELPASIPNTQGVELPSTGGVGTTIFYAGGAMLVLLAGILLVSKRRIA